MTAHGANRRLPAASRAWPTTLPNRTGGGGGGPGAEHRFFASFARFSRVLPGFSVLDAQDVIYDAVSLRFGVGFELEAQDAMYDALILRFTDGLSNLRLHRTVYDALILMFRARLVMPGAQALGQLAIVGPGNTPVA